MSPIDVASRKAEIKHFPVVTQTKSLSTGHVKFDILSWHMQNSIRFGMKFQLLSDEKFGYFKAILLSWHRDQNREKLNFNNKYILYAFTMRANKVPRESIGFRSIFKQILSFNLILSN